MRSARVRLATVVFLSTVAAGLASSRATAQGNYEVQVYGAVTVAPKTTMIELHSNYTFEGEKLIPGVLPYGTTHAVHETVEITQGLTSWSEIGFYYFTSEQKGSGVQWVGSHIRPRVRAPESWQLPVGLSLSMEMGYQKASYSPDTWTWEIRPIIDKTMGRTYVSLNPTLSRAWHGPGTAHGVEFEPNVKVGFDVTKEINAGVEYYGAMGKLGSFDPSKVQEHSIYGAVDLDVSPNWEINFGLGVGLTDVTDHLIFKTIIGRRISWGGKH